MYIIGKSDIPGQDDIARTRKSITFDLPQDYIDFLYGYGYGTINEELFFQCPDPDLLTDNFQEYMDLWDWEDPSHIPMALSGLTISTSIDGDIICCVDHNGAPYLLLPRHSRIPLFFESFGSLLAAVIKVNPDDLYFDPYHDAVKNSFSLTSNGKPDKNLIDSIHQSFLERYAFDRVFNPDTQPKYVIQDMGGWVYFDLIYKNSIRIKYQLPGEQKGHEIKDFLTGMIGQEQ